MKEYYKAYDDRYKKVHDLGLIWMENKPSPIVMETINKLNINYDDKILEVGFGEGRDSIYLLDKGYNLVGVDVSRTAVDYCNSISDSNSFYELDILKDDLDERFDFIYSIAVLHMLVLDKDRLDFLRGIYRHLKEDGHLLLTSMGDGEMSRSSDIDNAFNQVERVHRGSNTSINIPETSCRIVDWARLEKELEESGFKIVEKAITKTVPEFNSMMYIIAKK